MSRIAIVLTVVCASLPLFANAAAPAACGDRIQAFNEYEELQNGKIVEKISLFDLPEWTPDAGFQGLAVNAGEKAQTRLEIEVRKKGAKKALKKKDWPVKAWNARKDFQVLDGFQPKDVFTEAAAGGTYVARLVLNGKVLCEEPARAVVGGH